ncbi:dead end protein 1 isoform X1 [Salvelinus sp. IW2-2015]|uniref:dead end protein 1 isoform X2 n=1 Tax=Salvelinus sp. IW2-2015 TaxID=2691554 RepID=UPI000CDF8233|nr:dead end protein homolog 1 isoform X1 [Salvelinus alpinus]
MEEHSSQQVLNPERLKALEMWLQETDVKLTQVNGQRKYGGPPDDWLGAPPGPGCEVFISQIPRDVFEDQLIPLFRAVGPLWEFRLMMNFSGQNRGFAYAKYDSPASAAAAIRSLHGRALGSGARLSVRRSTEKRQLCIGELPTSTRREQLLQVLLDFSEGVEGVSLRAGPGEQGMSAVVVYASHHAASMAKKVLIEAFKKRFGLAITLKWQSSSRPKHEEPPRPSKTPPSSPPKPPRRSLDSPRPPLRLAQRQLPAFSRAVRAPSPMVHAAPESSRGATMVPPVDAAALLQGVCEVYGQGKPLYDLQYHNMGPDGFLCFSYRVYVPGLATPFTGMVQTLPGPTPGATQEEARRATAQQVLSTLYRA